MQMAMLLATLCSSSVGVLAFQLPAPRTRFGCKDGSGLACGVFYQQRAIEGISTTIVGRNLLYGIGVGSSGGEDIKEEASLDAGQKTRESSDGREEPARVNLVKKYGSAGLVAYGLLNGIWYTGGITYVMLGPMGLVPATGIEETISASVKQLGKVVGLVWLGSQATKPVRYALAALLSPAADRLIDATQRRLGLSKKAEAVKILVVSIFGSTCLFCLAIIALAVARAAVVSTAAPTASAMAPATSSSATLMQLGVGQRGGVCFGGGVDCGKEGTFTLGYPSNEGGG
eukprot:g20042.t1